VFKHKMLRLAWTASQNGLGLFDSLHGLVQNTWGRVKTSVATVMTDVFHTNEINLLRKFAKFVRIFDKIDDPKNRGVLFKSISHLGMLFLSY
jgi:hypothetical protein